MASSLIKINEATAEQLKTLDLIDAERAGRIIRYREEVAPIRNEQDLSAAAGLSEHQVRQVSRGIDWTSARRLSLTVLAAPLAILFVSLALIIHGSRELTLDAGGPTGSLYNISISLLLPGYFFGIIALAGYDIMGRRLHTQALLIAITAFAAGSLILLSLALTNAMLNRPGEQVMRTGNFVVYTLMVIYLLYAPTLHVKFVAVDPTGRSGPGAKIYDLGQIPLVCIAVALILFNNSETLIEEIFCLWAGFLFISNGFEMIRGSSSYLAMLSATQKARRRFTARERGMTEDTCPGPGPVAGALLVLGGVTLLVIALVNPMG